MSRYFIFDLDTLELVFDCRTEAMCRHIVEVCEIEQHRRVEYLAW